MEHGTHGLSLPAFMPHGHCYLWTPGILWMDVFANAVIALAYYSIPVALFYFIRNRKDLPYQHVFLLFGFFITFCGTGHLVDIVTIWKPIYWVKAGLDFATAAVSIGTAVVLWPLLPRLLKAGTIEEHLQRIAIESLEGQKQALEESNARLAKANAELHEHMEQMRRTTAMLAEREARIQELRNEVARLKGDHPGAPGP